MKYVNKNIVRAAMRSIIALMVVFALGCEKMEFADDLAGFDPEGDLVQFAVNLTGPGQASGERLLDIGEGKIHQLTPAGETPELIDFIMLWGSASGMNLVSPIDMARLDSWAAGVTINENWLVKNATTFIKLSSADEYHQLYEQISRADEVKPAYEHALSIVELQEGYQRTEHGPGLSIRQVSPGDILFFKTSKDVYAVGKVVDLNTGTSGSLSMVLKVDLRAKKEIPPVAASEKIDMYNITLTRPGYLNGQRYWDVSSGETYQVSSTATHAEHAFYHQEKIDLVFFNNSNFGYFNLISPHAQEHLSNWGSGETINQDWLTKNEGEILKVEASDFADSLFLYSYTKSLLSDAYEQVLSTGKYQESGLHVSNLAQGDLIFYKSQSKNILAMMQVTAHTSGGAGAMTLSVKVDNTEKVEVPPSPYALNYGQIKVGGWSNLGPEGNTYHVDLATITRHNPASADANQGHIDLLNLWSGSGFVNFMAPISGSVTGWGSSTRIVDWTQRNDGTFILQSAPTAEELATFEGLVNRDLLVQAYETAESTVASRPDYVEANNGPSIRIRHLAEGDLVYFKSNTPGRNLYAAIQVISITPGTANGREVVEINVKSNLLQDGTTD